MSQEGRCCPLCPCPCNDPTRAGHHANRTAPPIRSQPNRPARTSSSGSGSSGSVSTHSWTQLPPRQSSSSRPTNHNNTRTRQNASNSSMDNGVRETLQINELLLLKRKLQVLETRLQVLEAQLGALMERNRRLGLLRGNVVTAVNHEFDEFGPV